MNLEVLKTPAVECACPTCARNCSIRPGWPTPEEAEQLIAQGYGDQLMLDWWEPDREHSARVFLLMPALRGYENRETPFPNAAAPRRDCVFLSEQLCLLHEKPGLKPIECRLAKQCDPERTEDLGGLHEAVKELWNNPVAQAIATTWAEMRGLRTPPQDPLGTMLSFFESFLGR